MAIEVVVKKKDFKEKARKFWDENKEGIVYTVGTLSLAALAIVLASRFVDADEPQDDNLYASLVFNFKDKEAYEKFLNYLNESDLTFTPQE